MHGETISCLWVSSWSCRPIQRSSQISGGQLKGDEWDIGPKSNPAGLPLDQKSTIYELFALLFQAAVETSTSPNPVRFLSRYDKSANNIRESMIWTTIEQTPWSHPYSSWYHRYVNFPFGALRAASRLGEYTLVDRGSWYAIGDEVRREMTVFVSPNKVQTF